MTAYGDALAAVNLHPDSPDDMFTGIQNFLKNPKAFKDADPTWRGTKDALSWFESPKGVARLIWPFHWGSWVGNAPGNDAQIRAVFKIPAGTPTKQGLSKLYGFPFVSSMQYTMQVDDYAKQGGGGFDLGSTLSSIGSAIKSGVDAAANVGNTLHIPGINLTAALLTGEDPIAALKADVNSFMQAGAIAKGVVTGDMNPLAQAGVKAAASFGVKLDAGQVAQIAAAAKTGDANSVASIAMGDAYTAAWQTATNNGAIYDPSLPAPPGMAYQPTAVPHTAAAIATHPVVAASKALDLHLGPAKAALAAALPPPPPKPTKPWMVYVPAGVGVALSPFMGPVAVVIGGVGSGLWAAMKKWG